MAGMVICPAKMPIYFPFMLVGFSPTIIQTYICVVLLIFKAFYPHNGPPGVGNKKQVVVFLFLWRRKLRHHYHISIFVFQAWSLRSKNVDAWREIPLWCLSVPRYGLFSLLNYRGYCLRGRTSLSPLGTAIVLTAKALTRREPARQTAWLLITELTARHLQAAAVAFCYSIFIYLLTLGEESPSLEEKCDLNHSKLIVWIYKNILNL